MKFLSDLCIWFTAMWQVATYFGKNAVEWSDTGFEEESALEPKKAAQDSLVEEENQGRSPFFQHALARTNLRNKLRDLYALMENEQRSALLIAEIVDVHIELDETDDAKALLRGLIASGFEAVKMTFHLAIVHMHCAEFKQAVRLFETILSSMPQADLQAICHNMAVAYLLDLRPRKALLFLETVPEQFRLFPQLAGLVSRAYQMLNDWEQALSWSAWWVEATPDTADAFGLLALQSVECQQWEAANYWLNQSLKRVGLHADARLAATVLALRTGDMVQATVHAERALEDDTGHPHAHFAHLLLALLSGQVENSWLDTDAIIAHYPEHRGAMHAMLWVDLLNGSPLERTLEYFKRLKLCRPSAPEWEFSYLLSQAVHQTIPPRRIVQQWECVSPDSINAWMGVDPLTLPLACFPGWVLAQLHARFARRSKYAAERNVQLLNEHLLSEAAQPAYAAFLAGLVHQNGLGGAKQRKRPVTPHLRLSSERIVHAV